MAYAVIAIGGIVVRNDAKICLSICLLGAFTFSFLPAGQAKRLHDPQMETKVEMHRTVDIGESVSPAKKSIHARINDILHPAVEMPSLPPTPAMPVGSAGYGQDAAIMGMPVATQDQCVRYLLSMNPFPELSVSPRELVSYYYEEGSREGIRPDVAFAQALKETGYFRYGGTVTPEQNNYCGLGTTSKAVKGAYFATARLGVRAHIQHLLAYASTRHPAVPVVDPRYDLVRASYGMDTIGNWDGLNGRWAVPGYSYGQSILQLFGNILKE